MAKIVIIGGGVAGLSAGIYAQLNGHNAIIGEKSKMLGGNLTGWQRKGYRIDNCIHWLTGTNPNSGGYKMWETLGVLDNTEVIFENSLYTYEHTSKTRLSLKRDINCLKEDMLSISPQDEKEIIQFIRATEAIQGIVGIYGPSHNQKFSTSQMLKNIPLLYKYYSLSTGELSHKFESEIIQKFITSFLGDNFGSLALLMIFAHFCGNNGGLPRGGSVAMAQRMTGRFLSLGGQVLTNSEVVKINISNKKAQSVTLHDGTELHSDYVIATSDPKTVFGQMLDLPIPYGFTVDYDDHRKQRFSAIQCAFSVDAAKLPFESDIIFEIPKKYKSDLQSENLIVREFSHEPSFSPQGKNIIQTMIFCDEQMSKYLINLKDKNPMYYKELKIKHANSVRKIIETRFSNLKGKLDVLDVWTPATYKRFVSSDIGSFMSFLMPSKSLSPKTSNCVPGVKNLILATQWQQSPGGLPISARCGKNAIETIEKYERRKSTHHQSNYEQVVSKA